MTDTSDRKIRRRVRIRQIGGDDGYQWCLIVDGRVTYTGMTRAEAEWRRRTTIATLATDDRTSG